MSTLSGGGSRRRKKMRRMPTSAADIQRAYDGCSRGKGLTWRSRDVEHGSFRNPYTGESTSYRARILPGTIAHGKNGRCVYFVTKAEGSRLPAGLHDKPYEVTSLCNGGCSLEGRRSVASRTEALRNVRLLARSDSGRRGGLDRRR